MRYIWNFNWYDCDYLIKLLLWNAWNKNMGYGTFWYVYIHIYTSVKRWTFFNWIIVKCKSFIIVIIMRKWKGIKVSKSNCKKTLLLWLIFALTIKIMLTQLIEITVTRAKLSDWNCILTNICINDNVKTRTTTLFLIGH